MMAPTTSNDCVELMAQIQALARRESMLIDDGDYEAVWPLRERRQELTTELAAQWQTVSAGKRELDPDWLQRLSSILEMVQECDRRNLSQLERRKEELDEDSLNGSTGSFKGGLGETIPF